MTKVKNEVVKSETTELETVQNAKIEYIEKIAALNLDGVNEEYLNELDLQTLIAIWDENPNLTDEKTSTRKNYGSILNKYLLKENIIVMGAINLKSFILKHSFSRHFNAPDGYKYVSISIVKIDVKIRKIVTSNDDKKTGEERLKDWQGRAIDYINRNIKTNDTNKTGFKYDKKKNFIINYDSETNVYNITKK